MCLLGMHLIINLIKLVVIFMRNNNNVIPPVKLHVPLRHSPVAYYHNSYCIDEPDMKTQLPETPVLICLDSLYRNAKP